jgi:UDP-glucose 4-epimerase
MDIHGDGLQTRTFTYVSDTVDGITRALRNERSRSEVINIGGLHCITILELAELIQKEVGVPLPLRARFTPYEALPGKYQDVRERVPDVSKAKRILGFEATVGLDEGLAATVAWHQEQRVSEEVALA